MALLSRLRLPFFLSQSTPPHLPEQHEIQLGLLTCRDPVTAAREHGHGLVVE